MAHLTTSVHGRPHVTPVWDHYDHGSLRMLTAGRKLRNVRRTPRVAISIENADESNVYWRGQILGTAKTVDDGAHPPGL